MDETRYDAEWVAQKSEFTGRGSSPRRISRGEKEPASALGLGAWRSCALVLGLAVALAWTMKVAMGI